jgi:hypothetical protein
MVLVEVVDEAAIVDFAQQVHIPQRHRVNLLRVAVLLVLLQRFLIDVVDGRGVLFSH